MQRATQIKSCCVTSVSKTVPGIQIPGNSNFHCGESCSDATSNEITENLLGMTGAQLPCLSFLLCEIILTHFVNRGESCSAMRGRSWKLLSPLFQTLRWISVLQLPPSKIRA